MRLGLMLLAGCGPRLLELSPDHGSARGGDEVCLEGRLFSEDAEVFFDGVAAERTREGDRRELWVRTPPGVAGLVSVEVRGRRRGDVEEAAFLYEPLDPVFEEAPAHYLPDSEGFADAAAGDLDGDGLDEVVLRDAQGRLAFWVNTGNGAFEAATPPEVGGSVGGLAIGDGVLQLCHADAEASRRFAWDGAWIELEAPPAERGPCSGALLADLDGRGGLEALERRGAGLRLWEEGLARPEDSVADSATEEAGCGALSATEGLLPECTVEGGVATLSGTGQGSATLELPLPAVQRADDGFELRLQGSVEALVVVDDAGRRFRLEPEAGGAEWSTLHTPALSSWAIEGEPAEATLPLRSLEVQAVLGHGVELALDRVLLLLDDGGRALVTDFATWPEELPLGEPALGASPVRGEEQLGLAVGAPGGLALLLPDSPTWSPASAGSLPELDCPGALPLALDLDGDGLDELLVGCPGQDRLLRADGQGHWFDDTVASLPLDVAAASTLASADLDRDGLPEALVGNPGLPTRLYHADGARLVDWTPRLGLEAQDPVALLPLDVDGDADLDLLVVQGGGPARLFVQVDGARLQGQ